MSQRSEPSSGTADLARRLREVLLAADFTFDTVAEVLGVQAHAALGRNETTPGRRRTAGGTPIETLIRLFLLQLPVPVAHAERALPGLVDELAVHGFLQHSISEVGARLDVRPYATDDDHFWVVSDLTPGLDGAPQRVLPDHVLGISPASTQLAQLTLREPMGSALDLGTGCGVQALHLARHCGRVVATDVNRKALDLTRFNAALNGVEVDVRDGSFFEPVHGEQFDLIATNPPFVISPGTGDRLVYRDSGLPGDRVVEDIVRAAPTYLAEGGWCQVLANWIIHRDLTWEERIADWLPDQTDALVVQRETLDPAAYVELWLKDAGQHGGRDYAHRYDTWLSWMDFMGIEGIGFGWINLRKRSLGAGDTAIRHGLIDWPYQIEQPVAPTIKDWGDAVTVTVSEDLVLTRQPDVMQETLGAPGAPEPHSIILRRQRGLRRARQVDTVEAAFVGACEGDLTVGQLLDAIAHLLEMDADQVRSTYLPKVAELVREGYLAA
ncbi:MAG: DUF7059 domain-containing protein [Nocardioides sp.]